ncbi:DUF937 domain-containing protein [Neorhodopirellula lusitana]|uniref:DUF937 domain-containing protein n=1 Tax=Neorhodopirellula lusitana TaxID=445327 RepID=UPI00384C7E96
MSMNMMEILKGQLGGMVAGQIAKAIGVDPKMLQGGIAALLPTILGGLMKQASTPEGAAELDKTLESEDFGGGMFDNIGDMFSGGDTSKISEMGGGLAGSLFGDKADMIGSIVSKATGMNAGTCSSLMGMLVPIVMGFLGKQKKSLGLDSSGMANLLMSQKDEVAKAMPGGMAGALGLTDLGFEDTPMDVAAATPSSQPQVAGASGGLGKILIPLVILAALGFLAYRFLGGGGANLDDLKNSATEAASGLTGDVELPAMDAASLTGKLQDTFAGYTDTLSGITDEASAEEAVPELKSLNEQLGGVTSLLDKLPEGVREQLSGRVGEMITPIKDMLDKVMAIPGVGPILKPIVDNMLEKVGMLTA